MKARIGLLAVVSALAALCLTFAFAQWRERRAADHALAETQRKHEALPRELAAWEEKVRRAEQRAREAERDSAELLKAVEAARAPHAVPSATPETRPGPIAQKVIAPEIDGERLAEERAYHQNLARTRAREAKERAEFELAQHTRDAAEKFRLAIERARQLAANAEFQAARNTLEQALKIKPADEPVPETVTELQRVLAAQGAASDVSLLSDGVTLVSISNVRPPAQFTTLSVKLMPGDYEVVGRRAGFREVRIPLQVRGGMPPPVLSVVCSVPAGP